MRQGGVGESSTDRQQPSATTARLGAVHSAAAAFPAWSRMARPILLPLCLALLQLRPPVAAMAKGIVEHLGQHPGLRIDIPGRPCLARHARRAAALAYKDDPFTHPHGISGWLHRFGDSPLRYGCILGCSEMAASRSASALSRRDLTRVRS